MEQIADVVNKCRSEIRQLFLSNPGVKDPDPRDSKPLLELIEEINVRINAKNILPEEVPDAYEAVRQFQLLLSNYKKINSEL